MPKKRKAVTAKTADRHVLYQKSVQNPDHEVEFLDTVFRRVRGRRPLTLREDFCGTALTTSEWVKSHKDRTVTGLDLDADVLAWGREHNIDPLGKAASRVTLRQENVKTVTTEKFDICVAMNFSYFVFKRRRELVQYYEAVLASLVPDGMFFLDIYGGYESQQVMSEKRKVEDFTYIWDQAEFNPIDSSVVNHIHFGFRSGPRLKEAFTYEWRLWTPIEVVEALEDAGFASAEIYWEEEDDDGEGTGTYLPATEAENDAGWVAYIVARR